MPLLVVGPGNVPHARTVAQPVSLRDLPSTVVDLAGLGQGPPFPGRSLARCWSEQPAASPADNEFLLSETADELSRAPADSTRVRSLFYAGKVYIRNKDGSEELYDHKTDPTETHDLSKTNEVAALLDSLSRADEIHRSAGGRRVQATSQPGQGLEAPNRLGKRSRRPPDALRLRV